MHDVLLFDLGGVLVDFAGFAELARLLDDGTTPAAVRERWIHSTAVHDFERGAIGAGEFGERFRDEWQMALAPAEILAAFTGWNRGPYPGAIELLGRLRPRHRLACLSNANPLHTGEHRRRFAGLFDRFYFSDELRLAKPDPAIFRHVIDDLGLPPERIAFFDDTRINVEVAAGLGMSAHLVDGLADLERQLAARLAPA